MDSVLRAGGAFTLLLFTLPTQAAERSLPAMPRESVQPCPRQGPGFVRVPGSTTCIRVGGRAVGGVDVGNRTSGPVTAGQLSIDTRAESDLGPVRAFVRMGHGRP